MDSLNLKRVEKDQLETKAYLVYWPTFKVDEDYDPTDEVAGGVYAIAWWCGQNKHFEDPENISTHSAYWLDDDWEFAPQPTLFYELPPHSANTPPQEDSQ